MMSSLVDYDIKIAESLIPIVNARLRREKRISDIRCENGLSRYHTMGTGLSNTGLPLSYDNDGSFKPSPLYKMTNAADIAPILSIRPTLPYLTLSWAPPQFARDEFPIYQQSTNGAKRQCLQPYSLW